MLPPFGPGRTRRFDPYVRDVGRMGETDDLDDAYRFRTPSLRNVELTAPYGHNGAYSTLEGVVRHHLNPHYALDSWHRQMANLPKAKWLEKIDFAVWDDRLEMARYRAKSDIKPRELADDDIAALVAFLHSLTGKTASNPPFGIPAKVPSGWPVDK